MPCMDKFWFDYVKSCYDLVTESETKTSVPLDSDIEAYVVHLMAKNFNRTDIGTNPIAIQLLTATSNKNRTEYLAVADECLLIHSYPLKKKRWPTPTYYHEMGTTAYGLANHAMEHYFGAASTILNAIFSHNLRNISQ
jgi:hypothetical protein